MFYQRIYFFIKQGSGFGINRIRPDIGLLLLSIIWGISFPLAKQALRDMSPEMYITIRFWLGCLVLFPFFLKNESKVTQSFNKKGILLGLFMFLGMYSQTAGLQYTTAAKSGFLTALYVVNFGNVGATLIVCGLLSTEIKW